MPDTPDGARLPVRYVAVVESARIAVIREVFALFNRGELAELFGRLGTEDVEVDNTRSNSPDQAKVFRGPDEAQRFLEALRDPWEHFEAFEDEVVEVGDGSVVVESHTRSIGEGSGVEVVARGAAIFRFRGDRVCKWELFQTLDEALDAARAGR